MPSTASQVDAIFERFNENVQPGCVAAIVRDGEFEYAAAYGFADVAERRAIALDTIFNIASVSKQFTAFALLLLAQDGRLALGDSVSRYLPELPRYANSIMLADLLHHTGGLRDYISLLLLEGHTFAGRTTGAEALAALVRQQEPDHPPGQKFAYSNSGYFLLSLVIERVAGHSLKEFAQNRIFSPLGMTSTTIVERYPTDLSRLARGYSVVADDIVIDESAWEQTGDGQVHTTVTDLARWDENFFTGSVGGMNLINEMLRPGRLRNGEATGYGGGLFLSSSDEIASASHAGGWAGYRSHMVQYRDRRLSVFILANRADMDATMFAERVSGAFLKQIAAGK